MKVRILSDVSDELRSYAGDDVVDLPDDKAARFIKAGVAVPAGRAAPTDADGPEAAALADTPERADLPAAKKRGG